MDLISREDAIRWVKTECNPYGKPTLDFESGKKVIEHLKQMPSAQPEKLYTKADYIMALHKEYGCSLARAEKAHQKALEYLRNTSMMKG